MKLKTLIAVLVLLAAGVSARGATVYVAQSAGTFTGGTSCNGQTAESIATFNATSLVPGNTYYLCGVITTAVSLKGTGTSGNTVTIIFDTGARVSLPSCGQGGSCFYIGGASYLLIEGSTACGAGTACAANENANPTGYPSGITGIVEATASGTGLANAPTQGNIFYINGATNVEIRDVIGRNIYIHPATTAGFNDPIGGGGAFPAVNIVNSNNVSIHDSDFHDVDTLVNASNGPNYNNLSFYNNTGFNINWGLHAGTYGGQVESNWAVHDNKFATTGNWDQAANNAHHDQGMFLSRGGNAQGAGSFNRVGFYNNWLTCQTGANTTSAFYISGGPITKLYLYNNTFDYSCNATKAWSDAVLTMVPGNGSTMIWANNTIIDSPNPPGDSGQGCYSFSAVMEFVNNVGKYCNGFVYWQNYDGGGGNGFSGYFDYNVYGEPGTTPTNGYWQDQSGIGTNLNTSTFATWVSHVATLGCVVGTNGCETHSQYCATAGCLKLGTSGIPQSGSPTLNAGVNLTSLCGTDALLAALCSDTTLGNTLSASARPSTGAWPAGSCCVSAASAAGVLSASPNPVAFGPIAVGTSATPQTVTIKNTGNATATGISAIAVSDTTDYSIASNTCSTSLAASSTCTFALNFKPLSSGSLPATITVTYTGTGSPLVINISGSGGAGSYFVQGGYKCNDSTCSTNASTIAFTFTNSQIAGDLNICKVGWYDNTTTIASVASGNGNTYTAIGSLYTQTITGYTSRMLTYYATGIHAGNETFTVNLSASANDPEITCGEYSGVNAVDVTTISSGNGTAMSSGNVTTTSAADVLVGFNIVQQATSAAEPGWTQRYLTTSGNILEDFKPGATGTFAATATQGQAQGWTMQIVALKPGTAAPPAPVFSIAPSFYWLTQTVAITASGSTEIVYTTNGTTPSVNATGGVVNGTLYSTALSIAAPTLLQAIAWNASGTSPVTSGQYNIGSAGASVAWPLKVAPSGTYLTDRNGNPTMLVGDSPWTLPCSMTPTLTGANSVGAFFADRKAHGFNAVLMELTPATSDGCPSSGAALDGTLPFTSGSGDTTYVFSSANTAYFAKLDAIFNIAASYGITILAGTISTGDVNANGTFNGNSWLAAMRLAANCYAGTYAYGQFLGTRYANYGNIIWFTAEDFQDWPLTTAGTPATCAYSDNALAAALAAGVANADPNHLQAEELNFLLSYGNQNTTFAPSQTINAVYSYDGYDQQYLAYNSAPRQPNLWIEGYYEFNQVFNYLAPFPIAGVNSGACTPSPTYNVPPTTGSPLYDLEVRLGAWPAITSGSLAGVMYGSCVTGNAMIPTGWPGYIDTPGATQMGYLSAFWAGLPWSAMVPDQTHQVVTAGYGTYQAGSSGCSAAGTGSAGPCNLFGDNYVTTLWNPNGTIAVIYVPGTTTGTTTPSFSVNTGITVALSQFAGPVTAQWFDPTAGTYASISGSPFTNTGTHSFTPPSLNSRGAPDWVLLLQATAVVQTLTAPTFSPVAGSYVGTQTVALADATGAAVICYTTDGSTPTATTPGTCSHGTTYSTTISVASSETIIALATLAGYNNSPTSSAGYTIGGTVGTPTFAIVSGVTPAPQSVSITSSTPGATICYTTDGSLPTGAAGACTHGTTLVNGGAVHVVGSVILQALGTESGFTNSAVGAAVVYVGTAPPTVIILM
jgi:hypothetical protein